MENSPHTEDDQQHDQTPLNSVTNDEPTEPKRESGAVSPAISDEYIQLDRTPPDASPTTPRSAASGKILAPSSDPFAEASVEIGTPRQEIQEAANIAEAAEVAAIEDAALAVQDADAAEDAAEEACAALGESAIEPQSLEELIKMAVAARHAAELAQQRAQAAMEEADAAETESQRASYALSEVQRSVQHDAPSADEQAALEKAVDADRDARAAAVKAKEVAAHASAAAVQANRAAEGAQKAVDDANRMQEYEEHQVYQQHAEQPQGHSPVTRSESPELRARRQPAQTLAEVPQAKLGWLERAEPHPLTTQNAAIAVLVFLLYLALFS